MRKTHQETQELIDAQVSNYVSGHISETVLHASLLSLEPDESERKLIVWRAQQLKMKERTHGRRP